MRAMSHLYDSQILCVFGCRKGTQRHGANQTQEGKDCARAGSAFVLCEELQLPVLEMVEIS